MKIVTDIRRNVFLSGYLESGFTEKTDSIVMERVRWNGCILLFSEVNTK